MARPLPAGVRKASRLLSSSVLAQIAVLAATAVAAFRLSPGDFALFGAMTGIAGLLTTVSTLQVESRIPAVAEDCVNRLLRTGATANAGLTAISMALGAVLLAVGSSWAAVMWIGGISTLFLGTQRMVFALVLRQKRAELLGRYRVVQGLSNAALILVLVLLLPLPGSIGLGLAWLLSNVLGLAVMFIGWRAPGPLWTVTLDPEDWREQWRQVGTQPVAALMAGGVTPMPLLLLPALGSPGLAGAWALANRFLQPVVGTTYNTLQPLYYENTSEMLRNGRADLAKQVHDRWASLLAVPALLMAAGCVVAVVWVIPLLGDQWSVARTVVVPAAIFYSMQFWCLPLSQTLVLQGRLDLQMGWTIARFGLCAVAIASLLVLPGQNALVLWALASQHTFLAQLALNSWSLSLQGMTVGRAHVRRVAPMAPRTR